ncbi:hypothetical protein [halophilic archaeon]|uniref:hypothetical protein n=1 Tax=Halomicrococcus sp. SG-WS-1 TaxID=3439057 RepID=UPI000DE13BC6|nr:hypothetical protein DMJ13_16860 [halophilic archaeon]
MKSVALAVLQLLALAIPPIAVLIKMLRNSDDLPWSHRKWSFGMAILSIVLFISAGIAVLVYLSTEYALNPLLQLALAFTVLGLVPFALFAGVLYKEHRMTFGP